VVPLKVGFDQTAWAALWNSIYFVTIGLLRLESPVTVWKELRQSFVPMITAGWKLWPFAHLITYGLVPVEQRLLWVDMVEILWVCILATISNEKSEERIAKEEAKEAILEVAVNSVSVDEVVEKIES
jgi:protein Mpv17